MATFANAIPSGGGDLNNVLYEAYETIALGANVDPSGAGPPWRRAVRIGGVATEINPSQAFWQTDLAGGLVNAYALANQLLSGNTRWDPSFTSGSAILKHMQLPVPVCYKPSLVVGGLAALPFAYQAECETLVRKNGTTGATAQFGFGFENDSAGNIFLNSQGSIGFIAIANPGATQLTHVYVRADGDVVNPGVFLPMLRPVEVVAAPVLLKWRVTWGRTWAAELFANGELVATLDETDLTGVNLNMCINTSSFQAYPRLYAGNNPIAGPYFSRVQLKLVSP